MTCDVFTVVAWSAAAFMYEGTSNGQHERRAGLEGQHKSKGVSRICKCMQHSTVGRHGVV